MKFLFSLCLLVSIALCASAERPNIVWIVVDDMSSHFGYQGEPLVNTPNVDRLAREGMVFTRAYATAPVCSTFRSAMITGMYQTSIGAHHHRSGRGKLKIQLPKGVRTIPEILRDAGYYTTIADSSGTRMGKQDYNFEYDKKALYDGIDPARRANGQPFFAQYHLRGGKLRNVVQAYEETTAGVPDLVSRDKISLPPYYPDHPVIREDWAQYLDSVNYTDVEVGRILSRLKKDGLLENTVVFFLTDHGISHARGKQFLYEEGISIPFVVWGPDVFSEVGARDEFIAHIDLGATSLSLAGLPIPSWMQGRDLFDSDEIGREFVVSARDRCDETVDRIRSVRWGNFKYIRNYYPLRPYLQPCRYKDAKPFMPVLRDLHAKGLLNEAQSLQLAETRPEEELYDLSRDPWEIRNMAGNPNYRLQLEKGRGILANWILDTDDRGRFPESEKMYDSDMELYLAKDRRRGTGAGSDQQANISLMKKWRSEGR